MVWICANLVSAFARELLFNYNEDSSNDSKPKIEPYVSARRSWNIPESYGVRRYLRVSSVVLFSVQHSIIDFFQSVRENDIHASVSQNLTSRSFDPCLKHGAECVT